MVGREAELRLSNDRKTETTAFVGPLAWEARAREKVYLFIPQTLQKKKKNQVGCQIRYNVFATLHLLVDIPNSAILSIGATTLSRGRLEHLPPFLLPVYSLLAPMEPVKHQN